VIYTTKNNRKRQIDLSGPDGNAYFLLGTARVLARKTGIDADAITKEMMTGNYEHLLQTFDKHFGHLVDLLRP
jgi:hypothetical protein